MAPFLEYSGAAGNILHIRLPQSEPFATCFLPDQVESNITLSPFRVCKGHSAVRLQIYNDHLLLSVWDIELGPVRILSRDGQCTEVPISTQSREILFMLTNRCQFFSPASRWKIDLSHNEPNSGSMRPPPLPYHTVNPRDVSLGDPNMLANDGEDGEDEGDELQTTDLDLVEDSGTLDQIGEAVIPATIGVSAPIANEKGGQFQDPQGQSEMTEIKTESSPEQATNNTYSSISVISGAPATPRRKKLVDMEDYKDTDPQIVTPRPRKKVRFNSASDLPSLVVLAEPDGPHLLASSPRARQNVFHRDSGEESQELQVPEVDDQKETAGADVRDTYASNDERQAAVRQSTVWPYCSFTVLPNQPKVIFSSNCTVQTRRKTMNTFTQLGAEVVGEVEHADILLIPDGPLKRTTKFVLAVALAKVVVVEDWVVQSSRQQKLQCIDKFIPKDRIREQEWGFSLLEAMKRSRLENGRILKGWKANITPQLRKELGGLVTDYEEIAKALGVRKLRRTLPLERPDRKFTLILGDDDDPDLWKLRRRGYSVYRKDALVLAALRGHHDAYSDEFRLY